MPQPHVLTAKVTGSLARRLHDCVTHLFSLAPTTSISTIRNTRRLLPTHHTLHQSRALITSWKHGIVPLGVNSNPLNRKPSLTGRTGFRRLTLLRLSRHSCGVPNRQSLLFPKGPAREYLVQGGKASTIASGSAQSVPYLRISRPTAITGHARAGQTDEEWIWQTLGTTDEVIAC